MAGKERPISRKARAYLAAFDAWLPLRHRGRGIAADDKAEALDDLIDGIVPTVEEELASVCPTCGGPMLRDIVVGAQRVYCCEDCRDEAESERRGPH